MSWLRLDLFVESYPVDSAFLLLLLSVSPSLLGEAPGVERGLREDLSFLFHEVGLFLGFFWELRAPAVGFLLEVPTLKPVVLVAIIADEKLWSDVSGTSNGEEALRGVPPRLMLLSLSLPSSYSKTIPLFFFKSCVKIGIEFASSTCFSVIESWTLLILPRRSLSLG